jgi:hypothetical protein
MKDFVIWLVATVILVVACSFALAWERYKTRMEVYPEAYNQGYSDGIKEGLRRMVEAKAEELPLPVSEEAEAVKPERKTKNYLGTRRRDKTK